MGFANGTVRVLDAVTLEDELAEPFHYARDCITHIVFSHDSKFLATAVSQLYNIYCNLQFSLLIQLKSWHQAFPVFSIKFYNLKKINLCNVISHYLHFWSFYEFSLLDHTFYKSCFSRIIIMYPVKLIPTWVHSEFLHFSYLRYRKCLWKTVHRISLIFEICIFNDTLFNFIFLFLMILYIFICHVIFLFNSFYP